MLESIRSLNLQKEVSSSRIKTAKGTDPSNVQDSAVNSPNGRKPCTPQRIPATQTTKKISKPGSLSMKENVANLDAKRAPATVQKPLQLSKMTSKTPLGQRKNFASIVSPKSPLPSQAPLILSPASENDIPYVEPPLSPSQIETDPHRLSQRQKQITYGYRTLGYLRYRLLVPRDKRRKEHPRTPRKEQICSKRSWDGQVKKWRRELHKWDPAPDSGFQELLTADILESIFDGVPGIAELIKGLKEKLAAGKLGEPELEDELDTPEGSEIISPEKSAVVRTLVF